MELNKEQIKKIDSFLEAIGVEYIDIRFEMVDHIASEIEDNVKDINAFFKDDGFQTSFLKYMLSRKKEFEIKYKSQVKKLNWFYTKNLCKGIFKLTSKPKILLPISILIFLCIQFGNLYLKEISIALFMLLIGSYLFILLKLRTFGKKFANVKFVKFYTVLNSFLVILPLNFPNISNVLYKGNYSTTMMYLFLISLIGISLINFHFFNQKKIIEQKYNFLIQ
ncbi:hypothetical protein BTO06_17355 [Tenacibaculum sp. SZ-18]|uniref:hypothetical protein n=1 Tax=Tenacibaculum sp. SZ-18 TaxID=754423 RepID=UPI000C2CFECF|nr:hypothetical protein [Tenacibaculum sp. SZ-18]AUC16801.1 hypothetical protein BTO06_17355 [Tenacibaculum sp. SZ-18]